jgi:formate dehydrogenase major subunit
LIERNTHVKNVPLAMDKVSSHCSFCGLGCGQVVSSRGETVFKIVPDKGETLCEKGRFGFASGRERLRNPLLKTGGQLQECSWDEALTFIAKKGLAVKAKSTPGSIAIFASPALTMEEAQIAASWKQLLATDQMASFSPDCGRGLARVVGDNISTNTLDELNGTDLILMLGSFNQNQVVPARIRKAVGQGAKVIVISNEKTLVCDIAEKCLCPENSTAFIKEIMAALVAQSLVNEKFVGSRATGFDDLVAALKSIVPGEDAKSIAVAYGNAKKAMIVVDGYSVTANAVELMANLMVMTGKVGSARDGIIIINPGADSNGIWQAGFNKDGAELTKAMINGEISAAYILGEDPVGAGLLEGKDLSGLEFVMVASPYMTDTAAQADVVLPMSTSLEVHGSYITADGTMVSLRAAKESPSGKNNLDIWEELSLRMNPNWDIDFAYPSGSNTFKYAREFAGDNGKAKLSKGSDGPIFVPVKITDPTLI